METTHLCRSLAELRSKNLAIVEMPMVVAQLIQRFDMRFGEGYDSRKWEESLEDWFVLQSGELPVVLRSIAEDAFIQCGKYELCC